MEGGPKNGLFLRVDNFAGVNERKALESKFSEFCLEKYKTGTPVHLNILC